MSLLSLIRIQDHELERPTLERPFLPLHTQAHFSGSKSISFLQNQKEFWVEVEEKAIDE